jgi:RNA polymerase sigma-70 factor (ECF subfamily)
MDLVKAARKGREAAFLQLFDEHHLPLFRFAYRLTGSVADAEDIVQECFLELLRPACSYDPGRTCVRTYLFGVVRNQSLKRRRKQDVAGEDRGGDSMDARHDRSPESQVLLTELEGVVAGAVMQLPETQREVLILAHYEQMPLAEIARVMALEVGAVKSRLQRARASLKETLAAYAPRLERKR